MKPYVAGLVDRYAAAGVLVDTNLLLLYLVGVFDSASIPKFKRTATFTRDDHKVLTNFLLQFRALVTTPNILTEVSDLAEKLPNDFHARFAYEIGLMEEHCVESRPIAESEHFGRFGLADLVIVGLARGRYLVLTEDKRLAHYMAGVGVDAVSFDHLKH